MSKLAEIFAEAAFSDKDEHRFLDRRRSKINYMICFTPRSGSTWLGDLLSRTNKMGKPKEWFNPFKLPRMLSAYPKCDLAEYADMIQRRYKSSNGVFGFEATFVHTKFIQESAPLEKLFGRDLKYIFHTRLDFVAQAVSLYKSSNSGYHNSIKKIDRKIKKRLGSLEYDGEEILKCCGRILQGEFRFEKMFARKEVDPLRLTYEDLVKDTLGTVSRISEFVGVEGGIELKISDSPHTKIGDSQNVEWATRFREEQSDFVSKWSDARGKEPVKLAKLADA